LLFVLAAKLLQIVINRAFQSNLLKAPLPQTHADFPIVQYADDTLLVMEASAPQRVCLKALLHTFAESTGLRVNYSKSQMIPINLSESKAETLARTFGCQLCTMSFTYLGLQKGTTKPRIENLSPIMDRIERRLSACSSLSYHHQEDLRWQT
jgi:hypothetical protein